MILPLSIAYAVLARNLFDVDVFIRRTLSYVLASSVAVGLLFGLIAALSFFLQNFTRNPSPISSVLATLLVVAIFRPLHNRVNDTINRRFYRAGYEYQSTLQKASQLLSSMIEMDALTHCILDTIMDAIEIENGSLLLREKEPDRFQVCVRRDRSQNRAGEGPENPPGTAAAETLPADHALIQFLEGNPLAIQLTALERMSMPPEQRDQIRRVMQELQVVLVIPIVYEFSLIGVLGLGPKGSGAWYSSEDMDLLQTLMNQTAVSIENARKVEELKRMVELETSYRDLKALDEMKDNFLSMVSHDLRAPMTGIQGYAYLLQELVAEERPKQYLNIIIQQSERLTRLVSDLLDFQRFEAGRMELAFAQLDLVALVREAVEAFRGATLKKELALTDSIPDQAILISGHRDRLHQALSNLLSHAVKFTPRHGRISVSVERLEFEAQPCVKVAVRDTGPGIPLELQEHLFEKFQQVHHPDGAEEQGSGLGLALVRQIIEHHHGTVGAQSEPGQGSEFYFLLPVSSSPAGPSEGSEIHGQ
jgi:signal transduction histidine kinase